MNGDKVPNPYTDALFEYAGQHNEVVALAGDTAGADLSRFQTTYRNRFFNLGMAEQNLIGIAGGMARGGLVPFVHTFSSFLTRRPFDQIVMAIGYPRLRVRLIGTLCGINSFGVSHQAIDDMALMRAVPGMTVLDLAEATEIRTALPALTTVDGPVYCRMVFGDVPVLFDTPFKLGVARVFSRGSDLALISSSITTLQALRAAEILSRAGVSVQHVHVATVHPLDAAAILKAVEGTRATIVVENHLTTGGLGSAVAELMAAHGSSRHLVRLGLRDTYACGGTERYLLARYGMDAGAILSTARSLLDLDPSIGAGDVEFVEIQRASASASSPMS